MKNSILNIKYVKINDLKLSCPIKKILISFRQKQLNSNLNEFNDQTNRKRKNTSYRIARYITLFENKRNYMYKLDLNITKTSKNFYRRFLKLKQFIHKNSLFRDDLFKKTCFKIKDKNETKIIQNIVRLIDSFAKILVIYEITHFKHLIKNVNEN